MARINLHDPELWEQFAPKSQYRSPKLAALAGIGITQLQRCCHELFQASPQMLLNRWRREDSLWLLKVKGSVPENRKIRFDEGGAGAEDGRMARQLRIEYGGAMYHVMARGNQGRSIFADDLDRKQWLQTLGEACEKTGWRIHAYVMMGNHYHLLVETPEGNLVAGMKWLQGAYTQRYNSRHRLFGHLFQGRYKALAVDGQAGHYLQVVSTYIHLNPARAKLIRIGKDRLRQYGWSSYPLYLQSRLQRPGWLETRRVLGELGLGPKDGSGYEAYLEGRTLELGLKAGREELNRQWKNIRRGWYVGGSGFRGGLVKRLKQALARGRGASYSAEAKQEHGETEAERLMAQGMAALGLAVDELESSPKNLAQKCVLAWWLRQRTTVGRRWISERLFMGDESAVTRAVRQMKGKTGRKLERMKKQLMQCNAQ